MTGKQRCGWHWLATRTLAEQLAAAETRLARAQARPGYVFRARVPQAEWPAGGRWCSGCQSMIPLFYVSGSQCKACRGRSQRASHVQRTYGLDPAEEHDLLAWQGGRCFICGRRQATRRLAVDHDHVTGAVRGLLCSDDEHGCNVLLRRLLADEAAAQRLVAYVQKTPIARMRDGEPPWRYTEAPQRDDGPPPF